MLVILGFTVAALAGLLAMVTKFTVDSPDPAGLPRFYGRHVGFAVPLLLVGYAVGARELGGLGPRGIRAMGLGGLAAAAGVWLVSRSFVLYPWDGPTAFAFSTWEGRAIIPGFAMAMLVAPYLSMLASYRRWAGIYASSLAGVFVLGHLATFGWQKPWSDAMAEKAGAGRAVRAMVGRDELDRGLVVGANRNHAFSAVLFGLRAPAHVLELPRGATLDVTVLPADVPWVAAFDEYDIRLPMRGVVRGPGFTIGRLDRTEGTEDDGLDEAGAPTGPPAVHGTPRAP